MKIKLNIMENQNKLYKNPNFDKAYNSTSNDKDERSLSEKSTQQKLPPLKMSNPTTNLNTNFYFPNLRQIKNKTLTHNLSFLVRNLRRNKALDFHTSKLISELIESNNQNKEKENIMLLKQRLNNIGKRLNELRISYNKLIIEKNENLAILNEAIRSSQLTQSPVYLDKNANFVTAKSITVENDRNQQASVEEENTVSKSEKDDILLKQASNPSNERAESSKYIDSLRNMDSLKQDTNKNFSKDTEGTKKNINSNNNNDIIKEKTEEESKVILDDSKEKLDDSKIRTDERVYIKNGILNNEKIVQKTGENFSTIPAKSYQAMKIKSEISLLKHKLMEMHEKLRVKDDEIQEMNTRSTMKNLREQSDKLLNTINKVYEISQQKVELESVSLPSTKSTFELAQNELEYRKVINKALVNDSITIKEKYDKIKKENEQKQKSISNLEEKYNINKFRYNQLKQSENKKIIELKNINDKINHIQEFKEYNEFSSKDIEKNKEEIQKLREELNKKTTEYNQIEKEKSDLYQSVKTRARKVLEKQNKDKNYLKTLRKTIDELELNILTELEKYEQICYKKAGKKYVKDGKNILSCKEKDKVSNKDIFKECKTDKIFVEAKIPKAPELPDFYSIPKNYLNFTPNSKKDEDELNTSKKIEAVLNL